TEWFARRLRACLKSPVGNTELGSSVNPQARMPALPRSAGILARGFWRHPCRQFRVLKQTLTGERWRPAGTFLISAEQPAGGTPLLPGLWSRCAASNSWERRRLAGHIYVALVLAL